MGLFKTSLILYGAHAAAKRGYSEYSDRKQPSNQGKQSQQSQQPLYQQTTAAYQQAPPLPPRYQPQNNSTWAERQYQAWEEKTKGEEMGGRRCTCGGGN